MVPTGEEEVEGNLQGHRTKNPALCRAIYCVVFLLSTSIVLYYHAFAAYIATPGLLYSTCADTVFDGVFSSEPFTIHCPPRCSDFWIGNKTAYAVYSGTNNSYRGDSKLCRGGLHAGLLNDATGGCVRVRVGEGEAGYRGQGPNGGVSPLPNHYFPWSLYFKDSNSPYCTSLQWPYLAVVSALAVLAFALLPSVQEAWSVTITSFFGYLVFTARGGNPVTALVEGTGAGMALAGFCAMVWELAGRHTLLPFFSSPPSQTPPYKTNYTLLLSLTNVTLFYLIPFIIAMHMNFFTVVVPDVDLSGSQALTASAIGFLAVLGVVLLVGVGLQAREVLRSPGLAWPMLQVYGAVLVGLVAVSAALGERGWAVVHIHHSILALLLLPLTRFPTRFSCILQGVLMGVLLNGVSFWGVAGPWDDATPQLSATPLPAPNCNFSVRMGGGSAAAATVVSWGCEEGGGGVLPPGGLWALTINGFPLYSGVGNEASLGALPPLANITASLAVVNSDGSGLSLPSDPFSFTVH